jgi:hypothetical protein
VLDQLVLQPFGRLEFLEPGSSVHRLLQTGMTS